MQIGFFFFRNLFQDQVYVRLLTDSLLTCQTDDSSKLKYSLAGTTANGFSILPLYNYIVVTAPFPRCDVALMMSYQTGYPSRPQSTITCSKLRIETLENGVKYVQS